MADDYPSSNRHCLGRLLNRHEYSSSETESVYRVHAYPAEYASLRSLVVLMIILDLSISITNFVFVAEPSIENVSNFVLAVLFVLVLVFLCTKYMSSRHLATVGFVVVLLCLCSASMSFPIGYVTSADRKQSPPAAIGVWRIAYVIFALYAFVPLRIYVALVVGFLLPLAHSLTSTFVANDNDYSTSLWRQITANVMIFVTVNFVGIFCFDRREKLRRRTFDAIRASVIEQINTQDNNDKMDRLLLCILPPHVALEMKTDLRRPHLREIFPKAYIQRHDCVSIIVVKVLGLTALSAQCPSEEFVRLLNDLFGRFDQLATENHCLRLQMLGDRYCAACGLPDPRPDHAKCCIEFGLALIDVISSVSDWTDSCLQLRVGVHTGRVLSGITGLRRWKFDVWSDDLELARVTEQSGQPGRVHVTQDTVDYLQGEFPTEPGRYSDQVSDFQNKARKTYFIVADQARKRYSTVLPPGSNCEVRPNGRPSSKIIGCLIPTTNFNVDLPFANIITPNTSSSSNNASKVILSDDFDNQHQQRHLLTRWEDEAFSVRAQKCLAQIVTNKTIERTKSEMINSFTLCFKSSSKERKFQRQEDRCFPTSVLGSLVLLVLSMGVQVVVLPRTLMLMVLFVLGFSWISVLLILILGYRIKCFSCDLQRKPRLRCIFGIVTIIFVFVLSYSNVLCCRRGLFFPDVNPLSGGEMALVFNNDYLLECDIPHYIYLASIITLLAVTLFTRMTAVVKLVIWLVIAVAYAVVIEYVDRSLFLKIDEVLRPEVAADVSGILMLVHFVLCLYIFSRDVEWTQRMRFLWNHQVNQQQHESRDVQEANRLLVSNILPDHVTPFFQEIGCKNITSIYNRMHSGQVGVCFLTIVNLTDIYRLLDESNKAECFLLLNDIITSLDKLSEDERYKTVCKIKSFGTCYMSAVGLHEENQIEGDTEDWKSRQNLTSQVEFVLDAMDLVAQRDSSLVLRAGLSFGPVVAGVVGARKPQFDLWGETVSTAHLLERSGLPNCIQVTERVHELLQMRYQFHCRGFFKVPGKSGLTSYFLPGKASTDRDNFPRASQSETHLVSRESSVAKQPESSSYEYLCNSSAVSSSGNELPDQTDHRQGPVGLLHQKEIAFQATKVSMTPPCSLARKRQSCDDGVSGGDGQRRVTGRPPMTTPSVVAARAEQDRSPDLPVFHYRNVGGGTRGALPVEASRHALTQSQILGNGNGNGNGGEGGEGGRTEGGRAEGGRADGGSCVIRRQTSDSSTKSTRTPPSVVQFKVGSGTSGNQRRDSTRSSVTDSIVSIRKPSLVDECRVQESQPTTNSSPSRTSVSSQTTSQSRASLSSPPNVRLSRDLFGGNGPVDGKRLSKAELEDIDKIMKEFMTDIEKRPQVIYDANHAYLEQVHKISSGSSSNSISSQLQHQQQQPNNIIHRTPSNSSKQNPPQKMIVNLQKNGVTASYQHHYQPQQPMCHVIEKNEPRTSFAVLRPLQPPLENPVGYSQVPPQGDVQLYPVKATNNVSAGRVSGPSRGIPTHRPPLSSHYSNLPYLHQPLPVPQPASAVPFLRAKIIQNLTRSPGGLSSGFPARHFINNHRQPSSRPMSLCSSSSYQHHQPPQIRNAAPYKKPLSNQPGSHHTRRHSSAVNAPLRHARSLEDIEAGIDSPGDRRSHHHHHHRPSSPSGASRQDGSSRGPSDNISLSSYSGSEMSRSDPALSYDSSSAIESEYDNYRPGMASDEDYFVLEPISDVDLDLFDDINIDNVQVSENYGASFIPMLQKMITDV